VTTGSDYQPEPFDDLVTLSDEFDSSATLGDWLRNDTAEGWNADKLEQWDINVTTPGRMRLMPYTSFWYQDFTGAYAYKEGEGDFVVPLNLDVTDRAGTGRPNSHFSLAGILVRASRGVNAAAPQPDPGPGVVLPFPPPGEGNPATMPPIGNRAPKTISSCRSDSPNQPSRAGKTQTSVSMRSRPRRMANRSFTP